MDFVTKTKQNKSSFRLRSKKNDKKKKNFDINGGMTKKHIRIITAKNEKKNLNLIQ